MDLLDDVNLAEHGQVVIVTGRPSLESAARAVSRLSSAVSLVLMTMAVMLSGAPRVRPR